MNKNIKAFSLVEIMIGLIIVTLLVAAFIPVFLKRLATKGVTLGSGANAVTYTSSCSGISQYCTLCSFNKTSGDKKCIKCNLSSCSADQYIDIDACSCKVCPDHCICDGSKNITAESGYAFDSINKICSQCADGCLADSCNVSSGTPTCEKCASNMYLENNECIACPTGYGCDGTSVKIKCSDLDTNCTACTKEGSSGNCTACSSGFPQGSGCSGAPYLELPELGIIMTKYNAGDSPSIPIPPSVTDNTLGVNNTCNYYTGNCCFRPSDSVNSSATCDASNGNYSGCKRTTCDWNAANAICASLSLDSKNWSLPTKAQIQALAAAYPSDYKAKGLGDSGLQFCSALSGYSLAQCSYLNGPQVIYEHCGSGCGQGFSPVPSDVWLTNMESFGYFYGYPGYDSASGIRPIYSVRCVAPMCATNQYYNSSSSSCDSCPTNSTCDGTALFTCANGYYKSGNICASCSTAMPGCTNCTGVSNCTSVQNGYILNGTLPQPCNVTGCSSYSTGSCMCMSCNSGYMLQMGSTCTACSSLNANCTGCSYNYSSMSGQCTACNGGLTPSGSSCVDANSCLAANCTTCISGSPSLCSECNTGYFLSGSTCYPCSAALNANCTACNYTNGSFTCTACANGLIPSGSSCVSNSGCTAANCTTCESGSTTNCSVCNTGYFLSGSTCYPCSVALNANCTACNYTNGSFTCTACANGLIPSGSTCVSNSSCSVANCTTCISGSPSMCSVCNTGYMLVPGGACSACSSLNANCTGCSYNYSTYSGQCTACTNGLTPSGSTCVSNSGCTVANCSSCESGSTTNCAVCNSGYTLYSPTVCAPCAAMLSYCSSCHMVSGVASCDVCQSGYTTNVTYVNGVSVNQCVYQSSSGNTTTQSCSGPPIGYSCASLSGSISMGTYCVNCGCTWDANTLTCS